jgi:hypothetical protein
MDIYGSHDRRDTAGAPLQYLEKQHHAISHSAAGLHLVEINQHWVSHMAVDAEVPRRLASEVNAVGYGTYHRLVNRRPALMAHERRPWLCDRVILGIMLV